MKLSNFKKVSSDLQQFAGCDSCSRKNNGEKYKLLIYTGKTGSTHCVLCLSDIFGIDIFYNEEVSQ